jgi:sphingomyelin phosphodiesterase 2
MTDSWLEMHEDTMADSLGRFERGQLSASDCIQRFGITCDSPLDTWTKHLFKQKPYSKDIGDRLDYIFYCRLPAITCSHSKVVMEEYIPDTRWSYSDHFGVQSVFTIAGKTNRAIGNFAPVSSQMARPDFTRLLPQTLHAAIELLQNDQLQARRTANGHLVLFGFSVFAVFTLYIAQIILPLILINDTRAVLLSGILCSFFIILFSVLAIVTLVVGFVFGRMEQRSIRQYLIDLHVCLENLQMQARRESLVSTTTATSINQFLKSK